MWSKYKSTCAPEFWGGFRYIFTLELGQFDVFVKKVWRYLLIQRFSWTTLSHRSSLEKIKVNMFGLTISLVCTNSWSFILFAFKMLTLCLISVDLNGNLWREAPCDAKQGKHVYIMYFFDFSVALFFFYYRLYKSVVGVSLTFLVHW